MRAAADAAFCAMSDVQGRFRTSGDLCALRRRVVDAINQRAKSPCSSFGHLVVQSR